MPGTAAVSSAEYSCDANLAMVPLAWLPLVALYLLDLILWSLCWFCELLYILPINPFSAYISQVWFLEPRTQTHSLFIHSLNKVFINCLICVEHSSRHGDSAVNKTKICSFEELIFWWISLLPNLVLLLPFTRNLFYFDTIPLALSQASLSQLPLTLRKQGPFHVLWSCSWVQAKPYCLRP